MGDLRLGLHRHFAWLQLAIAAELARADRSDLVGQLADDSAVRTPAAIRRRAEEFRRALAGDGAAGNDGLRQVATAFRLQAGERDVLLLAAAPDIDARFGYLYGLVLGDPARRAASPELAMRLFADDAESEWTVGTWLDPAGRLRRTGLVRVDPGVPLVASLLRVPETILRQIRTGEPMLDPTLSACAQLSPLDQSPDLALVPPDVLAALGRVDDLWKRETAGRPVLQLLAPFGSAADAAIGALAGLSGRPVLWLDLAAAGDTGLPIGEVAMRVRRDAQAAGAVLVVDEGAADPPIAAAQRALCDQHGSPVVVICRGDRPILRPGLVARIALPASTTAARSGAWHRALSAGALAASDEVVRNVAGTYVLEPTQITAAAANAAVHLAVHPDADLASTVYAAAAVQSRDGPGSIARRITPAATWHDLVLTPAARTQLADLAAAARTRRRVHEEWGMGRPGRVPGVTALFQGRPGTGKTTAAEVIAHDLGVDLLTIDLAMVVSKWIDETEKNLRRVFAAARASNAVLFFDEADALFGKRSDVKNAPDRYANIQVAYLLQLMDSFDGVAVLATNLAANLDTAFVRRLRYTVEFTVPDAGLRASLWRRALPPTVPTDGVDLEFAAERFELTGGDIRNAALHAASSAAADGGTVTMRLLILAVARQYQKLQRVPAPVDFGPWFEEVTAHLRGEPVGTRP
jgi:hypothetical protein